MNALTDEERADFVRIGNPGTCEKALRIIDAHAADRAALVAQLGAAKADAERFKRDALNEGHHCIRCEDECNRLRAQVAELTRERDEARRDLETVSNDNLHLLREVTRLTEAPAAAERDAKQAWREQDEALNERNEARQCQEAAEARVRELTERVSQALTGLRPGSPVREALEEALRAP